MHLRVIADPDHRPDHGEPLAVASGVPAATRASRPGLALASLDLALTGRDLSTLEALAARDGVTVQLWALLAVEAGRALDAAADAVGLRADDPQKVALAAALDERAGTALDAPLPARSDQLAAYARELRRARPRQARAVADGPLGLSVPAPVLLAWRLAAAGAGLAAASWAAERAASATTPDAPTGTPVTWEAASAERGLALGEWAALQAASWSASRNAAAHNLA